MNPVFWWHGRATDRSRVGPWYIYIFFFFNVLLDAFKIYILQPTVKTHRELQNFWGMAGRSRRAWFSVLLGLVVGFTLASRLILPKATELKKAGQKRKANSAGCGMNSGLIKEYRGVQWPPQDNGSPATENPGSRSNNFLFVGVMTAQKYLNNRAVAAHRWVMCQKRDLFLSAFLRWACV